MPCISGTYDPKVGLMVQVGLLPGGAIEASGSKPAPPEQGQQHTVTTAPALIDTGASQTGISPQLATQLDLEPHGKIALQGATGSTSVNTYHVDFVLSFGTQAIVVQNLNVCEFNQGAAPFQVLIGRDIICQGVLTLDFAGHFTFSM